MNIFYIISDTIQTWFHNFIYTLPNILAALIVFFVFKWIAGLMRKLMIKILSRAGLSKVVQSVISIGIQILIILGGTLIALSILDLDKTVTSMLAGLGLAGLAVGYAFQDIISNFVSGVLISMNEVIHMGDFIEVNGSQGEVIAINLRTTKLLTPQGQHVLVPNSAIFESTMTNYSSSEKRRVDIECGVAYDSDLEKVERITRETIEKLESRNMHEPVGFAYTEFGDSAIRFTTNFWIVDTSGNHYLGAQNEAIKAIKKRFDQEGFEVPYPIRTLIKSTQ